MNRFSDISLTGWRQFERVEIRFHPRVTILTGPNGCGKTTILNILGRHFGWNINFVSTPYSIHNRPRQIWTDVTKYIPLLKKFVDPFSDYKQDPEIGSIGYTETQSRCRLFVPRSESACYQLQLNGMAPCEGLNIPSHRPAVTYHNIANIPTNPNDVTNAHNNYQSVLQSTYRDSHSQNPGALIKQSLISLAMFGYGNPVVQGNDEFRAMYDSFQQALRVVLPASLKFQRLEVRVPEIVLVTETGTFPLDSMSGGIGALFAITWQIHMFGWKRAASTILIDEPENHLHPQMQRSLIPSLSAAFPNTAFIVATHSPFIVSSNPEASVYGLFYSETKGVVSSKIDTAELSGSANSILREFLNVPTSIPIWAEKKIEEIIQAIGEQGATPEAIEAAMGRLRECGVKSSLQDFLARR